MDYHDRPRSRLLAVFLVLVFTLAPLTLPLSGTAHAGNPSDTMSIGLTPVKTALDIKAGETRSYTVTFSCAGAVPVSVHITCKDASVQDQGWAFADPGIEFWSAGSWLKVEPERFDLAPGQSRELKVTVTVPPDTPDGQYYAALLAQATPAAGTAASVGFAGTIASVVYIAMGDGTGKLARLVPYGYVPREDEGLRGWGRFVETLRHLWRSLVIRARHVAFVCETKPLKVFVPIENIGAHHIQPRVTVSLYEGETLRHKAVTTGDIIVPGRSKITLAAWPDPPLFARTRMELRVDYGGAEPLEEERAFWVVPIKGILGVLAIAFGLGYLGATRGRKRDRATGTGA